MEPKITPLSCDTENFCTYLQTYQGIAAGTTITIPAQHHLYLDNLQQLSAEQPQTPETKMHDQYAWAAFNFLVYVIAFCLILSFVYIGVAWIYDRWTCWEYNQKQELSKLRGQIRELEKKTFAPKGEPNAS